MMIATLGVVKLTESKRPSALDVPIAQPETKVQPYPAADDLRREPMALI
jgi:hypothetical protein